MLLCVAWQVAYRHGNVGEATCQWHRYLAIGMMRVMEPQSPTLASG